MHHNYDGTSSPSSVSRRHNALRRNKPLGARHHHLNDHYGPSTPLRLLLPRSLPRGGRRTSLTSLSPSVALRTPEAARRSVRRHEVVSLTASSFLHPTEWFSNFLAPSGGMLLPMSGQPTTQARSLLRIIPVDVTVRPPPHGSFHALPRREPSRRCFSSSFFSRFLGTRNDDMDRDLFYRDLFLKKFLKKKKKKKNARSRNLENAPLRVAVSLIDSKRVFASSQAPTSTP